jgi:hypothetical protein
MAHPVFRCNLIHGQVCPQASVVRMRSSLCKFCPFRHHDQEIAGEDFEFRRRIERGVPSGLCIANTIAPDFLNSSDWPKVFVVNSLFWRNANLFHGDVRSDIASGEVHELDYVGPQQYIVQDTLVRFSQ